MRFGRFAIDRQRLVLEHDGEELPLAPKSVELLAILVARAGDVVSKAELLDDLWGGRAVEEANLTQHVYVIRKALRACDPRADAAIVTVPKRGYRFVAPAVADGVADAPAPASVSGVRSRSAAPWRMFGVAAALLLLCALGALTVAKAERQRWGSRTTLSAAGAQSARLGRYYLDLRTATGVRRSRFYFARVIRSDPEAAAGYAGLADALSITADYHFGRAGRRAYLRAANALADHALRLDPNSADAHASLGAVALFGGNERVAERELRTAIALDPDYAPAHHWLGALRFDQGDFAGSARELEIALRMNPISTASSAWLEMASYFVRRYDAAIDYGRRAIELDPSRRDTLREVGLAYAATGRYAAALETFRQIPKHSEDYASLPFLVAGVYARTGHADVARRILARERGRHNTDPELTFALLALGERRDAARAAGRTRFTRCRDRMTFAGDPRFDTVRGDAEFSKLFHVACGGHA